MKFKMFTTAVVAAMGLAFAAQSQASTVTLDNNPVVWEFGAPLKVNVTAPGFAQYVNAGGFETGVDADPDGVFAGASTITTWCVDVATKLVSATYDVGAFTNPVAAALKTLANERYESVADSLTAAAFQVAVWEIVYDAAGALDLTTGDFTAKGNAAVTTLAQTWLTALGSMQAAEKYKITYLYNPSPDSQELMTVSQVPLPGAALLFASALMGAGALGRKKMAKAAA